MGLFALQKTAQCPLSDFSSSPGPGHKDPYVVQAALLRILLIVLLPGVLAMVVNKAPCWPTRVWFPDLISLLDSSLWAIPVRKVVLSQAQGTVYHPRPELWNLHLRRLRGTTRDAGFPADTLQTILIARTPSTRRSYALRWCFFKHWCLAHHADPVHCQSVSVLEFLQEKLSSGTCPGTFRLYVAAGSVCRTLIDGVSVGKHLLVACFIHGARRLRPLIRVTVLSWDFILGALKALHLSWSLLHGAKRLRPLTRATVPSWDLALVL
ncbi:Layilin [Labeo rohita]|uniref:Layilin n=1 Tax=Labeo rohita TaxID=84645 RepID=A0ABQ8LZ04_LABRO|nr:Layilin [Labeo rohita]